MFGTSTHRACSTKPQSTKTQTKGDSKNTVSDSSHATMLSVPSRTSNGGNNGADAFHPSINNGQRATTGMPSIRSFRKRQFHFWLEQKDFLFLKDLAEEEGESIARVLRRMVKQSRADWQKRTALQLVRDSRHESGLMEEQ